MTQGPVYPAIGITRLLILSTAQGVLLTIGDTVLSIPPEDPTQAQAHDRWHQTLSLSPVVALQLHQLLGDTLMEYAKRFGPITLPAGPPAASKVEIN